MEVRGAGVLVWGLRCGESQADPLQKRSRVPSFLNNIGWAWDTYSCCLRTLMHWLTPIKDTQWDFSASVLSNTVWRLFSNPHIAWVWEPLFIIARQTLPLRLARVVDWQRLLRKKHFEFWASSTGTYTLASLSISSSEPVHKNAHSHHDQTRLSHELSPRHHQTNSWTLRVQRKESDQIMCSPQEVSYHGVVPAFTTKARPFCSALFRVPSEI